MTRHPRMLVALGVVTSLACSATPVDLSLGELAGGLVSYRVVPSETDAAITRFNAPHLVVFDPAISSGSADLFVFMPGTGNTPQGVSTFMNVAAAQGYRAVAMAYNNVPAVNAICPRDPDVACAAMFRHKRIFGENVTSRIDDTPAESIVNRLTKLLLKLNQDHPADGWSDYLENGQPKWARIAISGHSQGAGMAAYIAQRKLVTRVVLSSSPWDFYRSKWDFFESNRQLAPWIHAGSGATPSDRWFGTYHRKESMARLIAEAFTALGMPSRNIRPLAAEPSRRIGSNPYHISVVGNATTPRDHNGSPLYLEDWRFLIGPR